MAQALPRARSFGLLSGLTSDMASNSGLLLTEVEEGCATGNGVLELGRHWRRSVQQHQSPSPAQAVLIKPSPFDPSSEAADLNEVETTSPPSPPASLCIWRGHDGAEYQDRACGVFTRLRSPDTPTGGEATKPTKKANHGGAVTRLHVRRPLVNMTKDSGDSVRLKCEVAGGRPGARVVFRWYKNDAPVEEERNRLEIRQYPVAPSSSGQATSSADGATSGGSAGTSGPQQQAAANVPAYGSRLRIVSADVHDTGYYRCEAKIGSEMVETTGILRVSAGERP
ncbi:hypothetical protein HPB50_001636 [Hyalomma asiaticum]|uniref:Uncharacterized protein n=1 Tax=Hyalomma asiaticum TaxID=266040 RepID=A0ACB7T2U1_HYAAI|nr:hypothetical protein HPB50_001636 [Hyalomma asiaticum]